MAMVVGMSRLKAQRKAQGDKNCGMAEELKPNALRLMPGA
jgi:hypothetical protein